MSDTDVAGDKGHERDLADLVLAIRSEVRSGSQTTQTVEEVAEELGRQADARHLKIGGDARHRMFCELRSGDMGSRMSRFFTRRAGRTFLAAWGAHFVGTTSCYFIRAVAAGRANQPIGSCRLLEWPFRTQLVAMLRSGLDVEIPSDQVGMGVKLIAAAYSSIALNSAIVGFALALVIIAGASLYARQD